MSHDPQAPAPMSAPVEGIPAPEATPAPVETKVEPPKPSERETALEKKLRTQGRLLAETKRQLDELTRPKPAPAPGPEDWKKKFLEDPTSVGLTYDEIAAKFLTQPDEATQRYSALERKIQQLEQELAGTKTSVEERDKKAYEQGIKQVSQSVNSLVYSTDKFEVIKSQGQPAIDAVVELIRTTFEEEDGKLMSLEDAASQVEDYLTEQALSVARLKKIQEKLSPPAPAAPATPAPAKTTPVASATTLTHSLTQESTRPSTSKDRRARAIAAFQATSGK